MCHMCNIRRTPPESREKRRCTFEKNVQHKVQHSFGTPELPLKTGKKYVALLILALFAILKMEGLSLLRTCFEKFFRSISPHI